MRRIPYIVLLFAAAACSGSNNNDDDSVEPMDAGTSFDATVRDAGPRDGGPDRTADAGFADPSVILQGNERVLGAKAYMEVRGTLTSTMPPVLFLATGPLVGLEYLVEPFRFLLGPGGVEDPDRLLIFADLRAVGRSSFGSTGTATVSFENHLIDMDNYLLHLEDRLGISGPYDLVGHGYGGALAAHYQVQHPEKVSRIVLVNPFPTDISELAESNAEADDRLTSPDRIRLQQLTMWQVCFRDLNRCSLEVWRVRGKHYLCPEKIALFDTLQFEYADVRAFFFHVEPRLREAMYDWEDVLTQVSAPTTMITGACDTQPPRTFDRWESFVPNLERHDLSESGHFPMVEEPDRFRWLVKRALTYP